MTWAYYSSPLVLFFSVLFWLWVQGPLLKEEALVVLSLSSAYYPGLVEDSEIVLLWFMQDVRPGMLQFYKKQGGRFLFSVASFEKVAFFLETEKQAGKLYKKMHTDTSNIKVILKVSFRDRG